MNRHYDSLNSDRGSPSSATSRSLLAQCPEVLSDDSSDAGERVLFARALESIRAEFEERTWAAFWRTAVEERPAADVAADLAMTPGAVRVAKSRVLHRLREALGDAI